MGKLIFGSIQTSIIFFCLSCVLSGCNTYSENALIQDAKDEASVVGSTANWVADENDISIKVLMSNNLTISTESKVDIGGDCFSSLYKSNRIDVYRVTNNVRSQKLEAYSLLGADAYPKCEKGRFSLTVSTAGIPSGVHTLEFVLIGLDEQLKEYSNTTSGLSSMTLRKM